MGWQVIDSGSLPPGQIMAKDEALLHQLDKQSDPILHFYEWDRDCLTYGYFTDPTRYLDLDAIASHKIEMARRPTGGGIILHLTDFAFSVLVPASHPHFSLNTLENYAYVNQCIAKAVVLFTGNQVQPELLAEEENCTAACLGFCMAKPTQYDLIVQGKKVGGAAQRRTKQGFLHQGSLSLAFPPASLLESILKDKSQVLAAMQQHTYPLLGKEWTFSQLYLARQELKQLIQAALLA
ncbi:lipoate--protein ligase family protein [Candidatus Protochlamydia phocaeensis]|uniref:lipoate--protein ligase family protein n=1 Tax=Candidatus Protochlamydia phocaeensis TaxID=1414722 RepID=UPI000839615C|nr:lipoate--protein ligase family protein [Candidatus Protochlamydia phocaeensis]